MPVAELHDGSVIAVEVDGDGPVVLLPVNPQPVEGPQADAMREWGADPALGRSLIEGLRDAFRVVAFDYEGHVLATPKPDTLTPATVAQDFLAVAGAAGANRFACYGYSWLAVCGLQLALRTDRLSALAMGGFPPIGGPYAEMLRVTMATYEMSTTPRPPPRAPDQPAGERDWSSVEMTMSEPQTRQFVTLYQALQDFDDRAAQTRIGCPRLCFAGSKDEIAYDERWDGVVVRIAEPLIQRRAELERLGWDVHVLDGLDHTQAMQATNVLPILRPWLTSVLS
jgi:pimeloyl-ACP methyl ester carboxylesterase